jgi:hypothetical protein
LRQAEMSWAMVKATLEEMVGPGTEMEALKVV